MHTIVPTRRRSTAERTVYGVRITIPARRNIFVSLFLGAWLVGWAFGEVFAVYQLVAGKEPIGARLFLLVWLTGWTIGGGFALAMWAWTTFGSTVLEVGNGLMTVRLEALGIGRTKAYDLTQILDLRVRDDHPYPYGWNRGMAFWSGPIVFDYGARTVKLGAGLEEAEAKMVLADLKAAMPTS